MLRLLKELIKRALYAARGLRPDVRIQVQSVNPGDQAWYFAMNSLQLGEIVYSLGLATNIEFDLNLIRDFGVELHGFDPTPESVEWIKKQELPPQFHHHPVAIAGHDGELAFQLPVNAGQCARAVGSADQKTEVRGQSAQTSYLTSDLRPPTSRLPISDLRASPRSVIVPCRRISSLMSELGHKKIALLKMDIEGSEYDVIEDILTNKLEIDQILVEFHHRFPGIGMQKTLDSVAALRRAGYQLFHISPWCEEFAFFKQ